jgi:glycosyltransferase involved in cell wall biosynthesis
MRILQVIPYFPPAFAFGGPPIVAHQISTELVKRGHDVTVYTSDAGSMTSRLNVNSIERLDDIEVHYLRNIFSRPFGRLFITPSLISKVKNTIHTFDIVHLHEPRSFQSVVVNHYASRSSIPQVLQSHGTLPIIMSRFISKMLFDRFVGKRILGSVSRMLAVNKVEAMHYRRIGIERERIDILPNGIDFSKYLKLPSPGIFRAKYGINDEDKIILFLGRLHKSKGLGVLIEAYSRLQQSIKNIVLVIAGPDEGIANDLLKQVCKLGLTENVLLSGPLYGTDKLAAYVDSDVFVLPSFYEIFGIVLLEAAACSIPIVASNISPIAEIISHQDNGLLFQSGNAKALEKSLLNILYDEDRARRMGSNARGNVIKRYSISNIVSELEGIYRRIRTK